MYRIATAKTFPLSTEIAVTTSSVDKKTFLCHVPSTETQTSLFFLIPHSLAAASDIFFCHLFGCNLYRIRWAIICICGHWWWHVLETTQLSKYCMTKSDISETVYSPNIDLRSFNFSATIVFGAVNLR